MIPLVFIIDKKILRNLHYYIAITQKFQKLIKLYAYKYFTKTYDDDHYIEF